MKFVKKPEIVALDTNVIEVIVDSSCLSDIYPNRKEGNYQESIQLPNTFRPRHQRERRTHLKQQHRNQNTTSRKPKVQLLSQIIGQTAIQNKKKKNKSPGHTCKDIQ